MSKVDFDFLCDLTKDELFQILYHRKEFEDYCVERGVLKEWRNDKS